MSYVLPQVMVEQHLHESPTATMKNLNTFIFGPSYSLNRYLVDDERKNTDVGLVYKKGEFTSKDIEYRNTIDGGIVDRESVKVWLDNVIGKSDTELTLKFTDIKNMDNRQFYMDVYTGGDEYRPDKKAMNRTPVEGDRILSKMWSETEGRITTHPVYIRITNKVFDSLTNDYFYTLDSIPQEMQLIGENQLAKELGTDKLAEYKAWHEKNPDGGTYSGDIEALNKQAVPFEYDLVHINAIRENTSAIYDEIKKIDEIMHPAEEKKPAPADGGSQSPVKDEKPAGPAKSQVKASTLKASKPMAKHVVTIASKAKDATPPVFTLCLFHNDVCVDSKFFEVYEDRIRLNGDIVYQDKLGKDDGDLIVIEGHIYIEHKDLITGESGHIRHCNSLDDIVPELGTIDPENPLAFGVYKAMLNAGSSVVYFMSLRGTGLDDWLEVLRYASQTDEIYSLVPLSESPDVLDAVQAHVQAMSTKENKLWRIAFFRCLIPELDPIHEKTANNGIPYFASLTALPVAKSVKGEEIKRYKFTFIDEDNMLPNHDANCLALLKRGDLVHFSRNDGTVDVAEEMHLFWNFRIEQIPSNYEVICSELPADGVELITEEDIKKLQEGNNNKREIETYHVLDVAEKAEWIAAESRAYASRRIYNVFPSHISNDGKTNDGIFAACAVAGLVSSLYPQRPLTNLAIQGFDDNPMAYQTYDREELNTMAAGGTFIIMQDRPADKIYVRHQVSTQTSEGNLLTQELSITKNLDSISYYFAEILKPYIGKYNITPEIIAVIKNVCGTALAKLSRSTDYGLYGPQVIPEGSEILSVEQDQLNRDHVNIAIKLNLPMPLNVIMLNLYV